MAGTIKLTLRKKKAESVSSKWCNNHCKWRLAIRSEEGDRPLHSDKMPSLNIKFFAGSGTPRSVWDDWEGKLEKLASV